MWPALVLMALAVAVSPAEADELRFTFIGNEAFHITDGETTLLSDFPYRPGAFGYMHYDRDSVPQILHGLSLITHSHADHWYRDLFEDMDLSIIGPPGITKRLVPEKVIPFHLDEPMRFREIEIQATETPHNLAMEHYSYRVTWHGVRIYFPGDTENPSEILRQHDIDVMFITPWLVRTLKRQDLHVDAAVLVVYHQRDGEEVPAYQDRKVMEQGETFAIGYRVTDAELK